MTCLPAPILAYLLLLRGDRIPDVGTCKVSATCFAAAAQLSPPHQQWCTAGRPTLFRVPGQMASQPPPIQDGPPPGGFPMIKYKRNLPKGGPSSVVVAMGIVSMSLFGFYRIVQGNNLRGKWNREDMDIRLSIAPFLDAEASLQKVHMREKQAAKEADLMSEVPGWKGDGIYKTRSYMEPLRVMGQIPKDLF